MSEVQLVHYPSREAWLAARAAGVGASESPALFGLSPWHSELSLWSEKRGIANADRDEPEYLEIGLLMEPVVAELYHRRTGRELWAPKTSWAIARDPDRDFMTASIDRWVIEAAGKPGRGVLEMKNVGFGMAHEWEEGPPLRVQIQIQHQLAVTSFQWGSAAGILGGNRFVHVDIERNEDFITELRERCAEFWDRVKRGRMPQADGADATARALKRLYPRDNGHAVHLDDESASAWNELARLRKEASANEKRQKELKNALAKSVGEATYGLLPDGRLLTYRRQERDGYTVEPTAFRAFKEEKKPTSPGAFFEEVNRLADEKKGEQAA